MIKLKIALDDGEILGVETKGYLNNHTERDISKVKISKEQAKEKKYCDKYKNENKFEICIFINEKMNIYNIYQ